MAGEAGNGREYRWYREDSERTIRSLENANSANDRYDAFNQEVHATIQGLQERLGTGSAFRWEFDQYQKQVLNELKKDNRYLPELSIVHAKRNLSRFDTSGEGALSAEEIKEAINSDKTSKLEKAMLSNLLDGSGRVNRDIQFAHKDLDDNHRELDAITLKDLEHLSPSAYPRSETALETSQRKMKESDRQARLQSENKVLSLLKENEPHKAMPPSAGIPQLELRDSGDYLVRKQDTILAIAARSLSLRGLATDDRAAIRMEAARLVELNAGHYPDLAKNPRHLIPGMILEIRDQSTGPSATTVWKPWSAAKEGAVTVTTFGDSIQATGGSRVIVRNGARAILMPGSQGFVFAGGQAIALAGSEVTVSGGNVEAYPGSTVKRVGQQIAGQ